MRTPPVMTSGGNPIPQVDARRREALARFLRYTYPALLLTPFFEEVSLTVNAAAADAPYWFEHYLFNADRTLFGGTPAVMLSQAGNPVNASARPAATRLIDARGLAP